jgi:hypothetical protein
MAKPVTPVDRKKLEAALREAEGDGPLKNLSLLWKLAADIYNKRADTPISFSVVALRVREWSIKVKTAPGRRGAPMTAEHKAALHAGRGKRIPRSEKMKAFPTFEELRNELGRNVSLSRFLPVVDMAEKGSLRAAIKLKCLDCCGYQTTEVKHCTVTGCSLYPHRPYKPGVQEEDEGQEEESQDELIPDGTS